MTVWRFTMWPRSLATRTAFVLLVGLMLVQIAGLTIHALDRIDVQQIAQVREVSGRISSIFRAMAATAPERREAVLEALHPAAGLSATIARVPPVSDLPPMSPALIRRFWFALDSGPMVDADGRPERHFGGGADFVRRNFGHPGVPPPDIAAFGGVQYGRAVIGIRLAEGDWLNFNAGLGPARPWHSPTFMAAFALMTVVAAGLILWAVRRLTAPVRTLAAAAEAFGRDVHAPPMLETGPEEVATAAVAFNTMAKRIRRFVDDRTTLLIAIGHDLRTPITRLKLRAEFVEDDEQRGKILADLEELEAMVAATLAFDRDARTSEQVATIDLVELLRTILDEAGDAHPDVAGGIDYDGPAHLIVHARSLGMKRALTNLISNAIAYGGSAHVRVMPPVEGMVRVEIADDGPGIPPESLERVFEPFVRLESSRNRETGGTGLGLPIARDILRAHGGDVLLANRPAGGLTAIVTLPV